MRIDKFSGQASRPDPTKVAARRVRNATLGPGGSFIETRPGSEHMAPETYMGAEGTKGDEDQIYGLQDDRIGGVVLVSSTPYTGHPLGSGLLFYGIASPVTASQTIPGISDTANWWLMSLSNIETALYSIPKNGDPAVNEETRLEGYIIGCRDQYGLNWFGKGNPDTTLSIYYVNADGVSSVVGGLPSYSRLYMVGSFVGAGCYILDCEDENATLYKVTLDGVETIGAVTGLTWGTADTEYDIPQGLAWTTSKDLAFIARLNGATDDYYAAVVIDKETAEVVDNYPSSLALECTESTYMSGTFTIGPDGKHYVWCRVTSGSSGNHRIYSFSAAAAGVTGVTSVVDTGAVVITHDITSMAFAVRSDGRIGWVVKDDTAGLSRAFLWTGLTNIELKTEFTDQDAYDPAFQAGCAVWWSGGPSASLVVSGSTGFYPGSQGAVRIYNGTTGDVENTFFIDDDLEDYELGCQLDAPMTVDLDGHNLGAFILQGLS